MKLLNAIMDLIWNLKSRFWYKHHLVDIRSIHYGYRAGYLEPNERLLLANFTILIDHVQNLPEWFKQFNPPKIEDFLYEETYEECVDQWKLYKEMMDLYEWWCFTRPSFNTGKFDMDLNNELSVKDEEMLIRLIKIRNYLWT